MATTDVKACSRIAEREPPQEFKPRRFYAVGIDGKRVFLAVRDWKWVNLYRSNSDLSGAEHWVSVNTDHCKPVCVMLGQVVAWRESDSLPTPAEARAMLEASE